MTSVPFRPRPSLEDLTGVARGPLQRAMLTELLTVSGVNPDDWNRPGRESYPHCRGWASYVGMVDRLRDALCRRGWTIRYEGFRVRLEPLTAASLRAEMLDGVRLDPSLELIAYLYEPVAGAPIEDAVARGIRTILVQRVPGAMAELVAFALQLHAGE